METEFSQLSRQGTLVFNNISVEYNNTNIQCRATLSNGETTLLVQGEREIIEDGGGWGQEMNEPMHPWSDEQLSLLRPTHPQIKHVANLNHNGNPIPHPYTNSPGRSSS